MISGPRSVRLVAHKWPDRPHWEADALHLGDDEHGTWVGWPSGTLLTRRGDSFRTDQDWVCLVPHDAPFLATFYAPGGSVRCDLYVDVTTVATWRDDTVTFVDLDLDVIRGWDGRVWVDDEDEFADHRVRYAYPPALVRLATGSCAAVQDAVRDRRAPYDDRTAQAWFEALRRVMMVR